MNETPKANAEAMRSKPCEEADNGNAIAQRTAHRTAQVRASSHGDATPA